MSVTVTVHAHVCIGIALVLVVLVQGACALEAISTKGGNITIAAAGEVYVVRHNASMPDTVVLGGDLSLAVQALSQQLQVREGKGG